MATIVHIVSRLSTGGLALNVIEMCSELAKIDGNKVILIAGRIEDGSGEGSMEDLATERGLQPIYVEELKRSIHPINDFIAYKKIQQILKDVQPDVVQTHASKAGLLGRLAAYNLKVPKIIHTFHGHVLHSYFGKLKSKIFQTIEQKLSNITSKIIVLSQQQKDELLLDFKIGKNEQYEIVPLGLKLEKFKTDTALKRKKFRDEFKVSDETIILGMIGRLTAVKNPSMALKVLQTIKKETTQKVQLFLVGDGELKNELMETCTQLNLTYTTKENLEPAADVIFTSWMSNIDEINAGLDVIILTSLNEGTPVSLIESKVSERPVVSTNVGAVEDIIQHEQSGFLVQPNDVKEFSKFTLQLIEDSELRNKIGTKNSDKIFQKYNMKNILVQMQNLYNN